MPYLESEMVYVEGEKTDKMEEQLRQLYALVCADRSEPVDEIKKDYDFPKKYIIISSL